VAEIYEEMGRIFSRQEYYLDSDQAYKFVISQYPYNPVARDALYALGEIYRADLENPVEARKTFQQFLERYPKSSKAVAAWKKLKEIDESGESPLAKQTSSPAHPDQHQSTNLTSEVTAVRHWVGPNYTRIVIGLDGEAKFETSRLVNPDRIVLDLATTRLSPELASSTFPVEDGFLHQIRVAQFRPNVTRVVLDVAKIEDYSVFTLPNPFRLIIDVHGLPSTRLAEKSSAPEASGSLKTVPPITQTSRASRQAETSHAVPGSQGATTDVGATEPTKGREADTPQTASVRAPSPSSHAPSAKQPNKLDSGDLASSAIPGLHSDPGSLTLTRVLGLKIGRVVIDPGHGGHDTGTIGPTGLREKDVVLDVALKLKKLLTRNTGNSVILTRSDDSFVPLEERTDIANEKAADLFVSIHANASRDQSARGVETYYLNFTSSPESLEVAARENATSQESVHQLQDLIKKIALTEKTEESHEFAQIVQRQVSASLAKAGAAQRDRGLKKAPFVVLIGANMPSILAEISFLTNPRDERLLRKAGYRQKIAEALYLGIARYVNTLGRAQVAEQARRGD
jgi:N-acetylmuramoyl-L-alanine amidase